MSEDTYFAEHTREAQQSRRELRRELLTASMEIELELSADPAGFQELHAERITPAETDGAELVYLHGDPRLEVTFEIDEENLVVRFIHFAERALEVQPLIFVSYSHQDKRWLELIKKYLTKLVQKGEIDLWDDSRIEAGEEWKKKILEFLESARAGLLLVSQDFLDSEFISGIELPLLLDTAKKKIFWIHLSPSTVFIDHEEITKFQSLLDDPMNKTLEDLRGANRKRALVGMYAKLQKAVSAM